MPVAFLTDDHLARYGRYAGDPTPEQLTEHFYLQPADLERLALLRQDHTRLGFALQLCTLRFLGTFLQDPLDVPPLVLKTVAQQLGMTQTLSLHRYCLGQDGTPWGLPAWTAVRHGLTTSA